MCVDPFKATLSEAILVGLERVITTRPLSTVEPTLGWVGPEEVAGRSISKDDRTEAAEEGRVEATEVAPKEKVRSGEIMAMEGLPGAVVGDIGSCCWRDRGASWARVKWGRVR